MKSKIVWFTGLSGSGKTTLANYIFKKLKIQKFKVAIIDGDIFRKKSKQKKFTKKSIIKNNISIINYLDKKKSKYDYLLVSVIAPLKKTRYLAYKKFNSNYFEVFTKCSLKELIRRDTKELYYKAKMKIIKNLIGYNSRINYENSRHRKIIVRTDKETIKQSANKIIKYIS